MRLPWSVPLTVLLGIREDFFARLQHFAPDVPDPTSPHYSYEIEDLTSRKVQEILKKILATDNTQFESALIDGLIDDLQEEGRVRPTEFQLIATQLKRREITRLYEYEGLGRASGILRVVIESEILRTPAPQLTRIVLRRLCSPDAPTKSPTDLSTAELADELRSKGLAAQGFEGQLQISLNQLIHARIVIKTEGDRYNLVHDYLAPMVKSATEGIETQLEQANRLARRYLAEYRGDKKTRIPLRHLILIQRHADRALLDSREGRKLRLKSAARAVGNILLPSAALVAILLAICYGILSASYYLSTVPADYAGGSSKIVVRGGNSNLKILPGFDEVLVDTGYSMRDLDPEMLESFDMIPREQIGGWHRSRVDGYSAWVEQVVSRLTPFERAKARRLLGTPVPLRDDSIALMKSPEVDRIAAARTLGIAGKSDPKPWSNEFIQPIKNLLTPDVDEQVRLAAAVALGELAQDCPGIDELNSNLFRELFSSFERKAHDKEAPDLTWDLRSHEEAVISLAVAKPVSNSRHYATKLINLRADTNVDSFAQWNVLRITQKFGEANPEVAEYLIKALLEIAFPCGEIEIRDNGSGWLTIDTLRTIVSLGRAVPAAITTTSTASLREAIVRGTNASALEPAAIVYGLLGQSKPDMIDSSVIQALERAMSKEGATDLVRASCAITLTRLGLARGDLTPAKAVAVLREFHEKQTGENDAYLRWATAGVLAEVALADPKLLSGLKVHALVIDSIKSNYGQGNWDDYEEINRGAVISRIARRDSTAVSNDTVKLLLDCIEQPRIVSVPLDAAKDLIALAKWTPDAVLEQRERFRRIKDRGFDPDAESVTLQRSFQAAVARARYIQARAREGDQLILTLLGWLTTGDNSDLRVSGSYGLFFLTLDDAESQKEVEKSLLELRAGKEPHIRMAANLALEMIRVGQLRADARREPKSFSLNLARLEFLLTHPEYHMRIAAQVTLEEMETPPQKP